MSHDLVGKAIQGVKTSTANNTNTTTYILYDMINQAILRKSCLTDFVQNIPYKQAQ